MQWWRLLAMGCGFYSGLLGASQSADQAQLAVLDKIQQILAKDASLFIQPAASPNAYAPMTHVDVTYFASTQPFDIEESPALLNAPVPLPKKTSGVITHQQLQHWQKQLQLMAVIQPSADLSRFLKQFQQADFHQQRVFAAEAEQRLHRFWASYYAAYQLKGSIPPMTATFDAVLAKLERLQQLEKQTLTGNKWPIIAATPFLNPGARSYRIPQVVERLVLLGDLSQQEQQLMAQNYGARPHLYNSLLLKAVMRFQQRHGSAADGVIGPKTVHWLNMRPKQRAQLLAKSFAEQQVYASQLTNLYVLVNIPAMSLELIQNGQVALASKVIVGRKSRQTPVLKSEITNVVLNPTWTVPRSLIVRDYQRKIRHDGHYLKRQQFDMYDYSGNKVVNSPYEWSRLAATTSFPFRMVQRPGKHNALGKYKIHFDNAHAVYLHDTNQKYLFNKAERALSSGCVRVEKVDELTQWIADHLMPNPKTWANKVNSPNKKTRWFTLNQSLPVHLVYWTAWLDEGEQVQFRDDIYEKHLSPVVSPAIANRNQGVN